MDLQTFIPPFALGLSVLSAVMSFRADRRARESVRPYLTTGVNLMPNDMSITLSNQGVGLAIITKVSVSRGDQQANSVGPFLPLSTNYASEGAIYFVQDRYFLRPGDPMRLAAVKATDQKKAAAAVHDWTAAIDGLTVEVEYRDILDKRFDERRVISIPGGA